MARGRAASRGAPPGEVTWSHADVSAERAAAEAAGHPELRPREGDSPTNQTHAHEAAEGPEAGPGALLPRGSDDLSRPRLGPQRRQEKDCRVGLHKHLQLQHAEGAFGDEDKIFNTYQTNDG